MATPQVNPAYMFAAGHGHCGALADLATAYLGHAESIAEDDPYLADEFFTVAELFAELARTHGRSVDIAVLADVCVARSIHSASLDPVRSLEYREQAEQLFDAVENTGETLALAAVAYSLNRLADANPDDDRASVRLNRVIGALAPGEALLVQEVIRATQDEPLGEPL
jgi:hypothetical protein